MKKFFGLLSLCLLLPLQACAQEQWQEGVHYEVISDKAVEKKEVMEFFSYWCPACFNFEVIAKQIERELPEGAVFTKVHVNFMGMATPEVQEMATQAMMIARALKQEKAVNEAIFNYIHKQRGVVSSMDDLKKIFELAGIDNATFDKTARSFGAKTLFRQNQKLLADYRSAVRSVPTFIVNGKYKAQFLRGMSPDDFSDLVVWLTQLD